MFKITRTLTACLAGALLCSGLGCAPEPAKSTSTGPKVGDKPTSPAADPLPPTGKPTEAADAQQAKPGGKSPISVKDPGVIEAANFACTAEQAKLKAKGESKTIKLVEVTNAQSQVVQGISYDLTLRVTVDGKEQTAEAVVWSRAWLKGDDKIQLTSWKLVEKK